jgi:hypothetical protein
MVVSGVLPDHVTHYYVPGRPPFLNLSEFTDSEWDTTRRVLEDERTAESSSRVFGRRYLELRRATEARLRYLFVAAGGEPERDIPHYFVLGSSEWFRGLAPDMQRVVIPLAALPDGSTSMTIPDSVTAMGLGGEYGIPVEPKAHHGRVFLHHSSLMPSRPSAFPRIDPGANSATNTVRSSSTPRSRCGRTPSSTIEVDRQATHIGCTGPSMTLRFDGSPYSSWPSCLPALTGCLRPLLHVKVAWPHDIAVAKTWLDSSHQRSRRSYRSIPPISACIRMKLRSPALTRLCTNSPPLRIDRSRCLTSSRLSFASSP